MQNRDAIGVHKNNNYVFASGSSGFRLRGWDTLQNVVKKVALEKPKLVTPTRTRKHIACMMQLLDITEAELSWITDHMGHTKDIHKSWYRKEDSTLELTKVARALTAIDSGKELKNKKIGELMVSGNEYALLQLQ